MPIQPPFVEKSITPGPSLDICYWKAEDSGYHTSYTPSLLECSKVSLEKHSIVKTDISLSSQKPITNLRSTRNVDYGSAKHCECLKESPSPRRGVKRLFQEILLNEDGSYNSLTPTSIIAGKLNTLQFSDIKFDATFSSTTVRSQDSAYSNSYYSNEHSLVSFPTTPIKKKCRSSCKENSSLNPNRLLKYDDFAAHSVTCEKRALQPIRKVVKIFKHKPNKKIDIIQMLYQKQGKTPPLEKIFSYLTEKDRKTVKQVSSTWKDIYGIVWETIKRKKYLDFTKNAVENIENKECLIYVSTPKTNSLNQFRPLTEIQNIIKDNNVNSASPPTSPSTTRFKRYTKAASLDSREQLPCVRCHQPSKVTKENTGEQWAECTGSTCSYQFCKLCLCDRHPGNNCIRFDLDGPSPSKRKKKTVAIGTRQSRKNLRRLL